MGKPASTLLCAALLASWISCTCSFTTRPLVNAAAVHRHSSMLRSFEEPNGVNGDVNGDAANGDATADAGGGPPPDLVNKEVFISALETLHGNAPGSEAEDDEHFYAIGKLRTSLSIASQNPGLDLAESTGLVLVSGSAGPAYDAGIQVGDTITAVYAVDDTFQAQTKALNLDDTVQIVMAAMNHAVGNQRTEIDLELNRLIKCRYK